MGRDLHYVPGSFYRVDDRTGFPQRAGRTRKEWNGLLVDELVWEPRQPQDLVRGVKDQQSVPEARPLAPAQYVGPIYQYLAETSDVTAMGISLQSTRGFRVGDPIGVMLDSGVMFHTTITNIVGADLEFAAALPYQASSGNLAVDLADNPTDPMEPDGQ